MNSGASRPGRVPARLAPSFVKRPWGSLDLTSLFPKRPREEKPIGEAWLTGDDSVFATGAFAGRTLGEIWPALPEEWTGTRLTGLPRIPLLVKFIFPEDKLSVQVHPDDVYAEQHEAEEQDEPADGDDARVHAAPSAALGGGRRRPGDAHQPHQ